VMEAALSFGGIQWVVGRQGPHDYVACMSNSGLRDFIDNLTGLNLNYLGTPVD
jgi:hypothetical protein